MGSVVCVLFCSVLHNRNVRVNGVGVVELLVDKLGNLRSKHRWRGWAGDDRMVDFKRPEV